jgi:transcriptional regulator GlxA family with amidase domain
MSAMHSLRSRFREMVRIEELAEVAQLSPSAFHGQFKALTSLTPLHYQKQLRLLEARRLMISSVVNVETAPFQVGYESQWRHCHINRFYCSLLASTLDSDSINSIA